MKNRFPELFKQVLTGVAGLVLVFCQEAVANPKIRTGFFDTFPSARNTQLENLPSRSGHCGVCHYNFQGGGDPWNPFGEAIRNRGGLNGATGITNAIWFAATNAIDYDGDGFANLFEITNRTYTNTPTFPGLQASNVGLVTGVNLAEVRLYLTPTNTSDSVPPVVTVTKPNGGEVFTANRVTNITWTASDASGVVAVDIYESLDGGATFSMIAQGLANSGSYAWTPANRPTTTARIRVAAMDGVGNRTNDVSNATFTIASPPFTNAQGVATTLRDFDMPGTQPFEGGAELSSAESCAQCHGNYSVASEPYFNWQGSMMSHASRDPLFEANMAIANQDAAESGDLCLRCHFARGWLQGRSVPTDGSRMVAGDRMGVACDLCHRMVDPVYRAGVSPTNDLGILARLSFPGTNYGNGMFVIDPTGSQRGPFSNAAAPHSFTVSAFHRTSAFCGTCHDVSNPAFTRDSGGVYQPNAFDARAGSFSPHSIGPVERTYSEWLASAYNTPAGVYAPAFAGNKADGRVSTCQDCHMRDVAGYGANTNNNAGVPLRADMPLHDMTGGSTWIAGVLTNLHPTEVNVAAIQAGIARSVYLLQNAASLAVGDAPGSLKVTVTNECGHKLPTGYPEGRRIWLNVKFYDEGMNLVGESGAYNTATGELARDAQAKIYEVHPGIGANISGLLGLDAAASLHFVLNNQIYEDNRIPPRGFSNAAFDAFGGAAVGHHYEDGQYWDDSIYALPAKAVRADVKLYYQSTSKEFVEFLRDENRTNGRGLAMYNIWATNGMCPPTLMASQTWVTPFQLKSARFTGPGRFRVEFLSRPGVVYSIQFRDSLQTGNWQQFVSNGSITATTTTSFMEDDFTSATSGSVSATGARFYRIMY